MVFLIGGVAPLVIGVVAIIAARMRRDEIAHPLDAGEESVKRGPDLLPVLRDAGVVDAGGYGLTVMFAVSSVSVKLATFFVVS